MKGPNKRQPILQIDNLGKYFPVKRGIFRREVARVQAVDNVFLKLYPGETLGIVGESGCGKSTLARLIVRLLEPSRGKVNIELDDPRLHHLRDSRTGLIDITKIPSKSLLGYRAKVQMVFQDPYMSLNPRMRVGTAIKEVMEVQKNVEPSNRNARVAELLKDVGLRADMADRYPHEFSGGQRQRVSIARALAAEPAILVADEPVSALDVSVQAQVVQMLLEIQSKYQLSMIFISHDLSVVKYVSDRVAVMYLGEVVECGKTDEIFKSPRHPYTEALMRSVPRLGSTANDIDVISGEIPSNIAPPSGCKFNPRCKYRKNICSTMVPLNVDDGDGNLSRCHFTNELKLNGIW